MKIHCFLSVLMEGYMGEKERKNGSGQVHNYLKKALRSFKGQCQNDCLINIAPNPLTMHLQGNAFT